MIDQTLVGGAMLLLGISFGAYFLLYLWPSLMRGLHATRVSAIMERLLDTRLSAAPTSATAKACDALLKLAAVQVLVADKVSLWEVAAFRMDARTRREAENEIRGLQADIAGIGDMRARQALERAHGSLRWEVVALVGLSSFTFAILGVALVLATLIGAGLQSTIDLVLGRSTQVLRVLEGESHSFKPAA